VFAALEAASDNDVKATNDDIKQEDQAVEGLHLSDFSLSQPSLQQVLLALTRSSA
jgi:hypothetical protein